MNAKEMLFLRAAVPAAIDAMRFTGVPASATIAQAILESGWGTSALAKEANNYFGVKTWHTEDPELYVEMPTAEYASGMLSPASADFARYPSAAASFTAHARLISGSARYAPAMAARHDPEAFCRALQNRGYSTNPRYAQLLIELMNEFDLTQYDLRAPDPDARQASPKAAA